MPAAALGFSAHTQGLALVCLIVITIALMIILAVQGKPLRTTAAPRGIGSYEFAWSKERVDAILASWRDRIPVARLQLLLDFPFLVAYPCALSLACELLSGHAPSAGARVGAMLAWAILAACPLDATENACLLRMLRTGGRTTLARLATLCAGVKFGLIFLALGYLFVQGIALGIERLF